MRKNKKTALRRVAALSLALLVTASLTGCANVSSVASKLSGNKAAEQTEYEGTENTKKIKVSVSSIVGNQITYVVTDNGEEETEEVKTEKAEAEKVDISKDAAEAATETAAPEGTEGGNPDGGFGPSAGGKDGNMQAPPSGTQDGNTQAPPSGAGEGNSDFSASSGDSGFNPSSSDSSSADGNSSFTPPTSADGNSSFTPPTGADGNSGSFTPPTGADGNKSSFSMPGTFGNQQETVTAYIPVGAKVYSDTGKKTTFSIIQAGDELELTIVTDEEGNEVITQVRIISGD